MIISFGKTKDELLSGTKTVTRRFWKPNYFATWLTRWDKGFRVYDAYDKSPRNGGKKIGTITLTQRPYREPLSMLTESELLAEGGMCSTVEEFCALVGKEPEDEAAVIRFVFEPNS